MIDAVLTWVDGNDPVLKAKQQKYMAFKGADKLDDVAGPARYVQSNEIFYAVASILRFAPYIGRIFIVTDGQNPHLEEFIEKNFPGNKVPIQIVDHSVIFKGYEEYLPVFNSRAIEAMLWRIPGLSEEHIFMNDDFFFAAPSSVTDFFRDGKVVCCSKYLPVWWEEIVHYSHPVKHGHRRVSYKDSLMNAARMLGFHYFPYLPHTPKALRRSVFEEYYKTHPEAIYRNIRHKFRHEEQYNVAGLFYLLEIRNREVIKDKNLDKLFIVREMRDKKDYFKKKLEKADKNPDMKFGCMNSLQDASEQEMQMFKDWIARRLDLKYMP
jgi:hypothetical protein